MKKLFKFIIWLICLILIPFFAKSLYQIFTQIDFSNNLQTSFFASTAIFFVIFFIIIKNGSFIAILEHELTHIIWGLVFLKKPHSLKVETNSGGYASIYGNNFLITLSPYFSFTLCFLVLPFYYVIKENHFNAFFIVFGILTAFHLATTIKEIHLKQTDIQSSGLIFSFIIIILGNILSIGLIIAFVIGQGTKVGSFFFNGFIYLMDFFSKLNILA